MSVKESGLDNKNFLQEKKSYNCDRNNVKGFF